jgi:hypothetical protein
MAGSGSAFTSSQIAALFEADSPILRRNSYPPALPKMTHFLALPAEPVVLAEFPV